MIILASVTQVLNMILIMIVALWFTMQWIGENVLSRLISPSEMVEKIASGYAEIIDTACEKTGKTPSIVRCVTDYDYFVSVKSDGAESSIYLKIK